MTEKNEFEGEVAALRGRYPGAQTFIFGDSAGMNAELLALVVAGRKTATCGALRDFESGAEAMPVVGRRDISLAWDGRPAVVIETVEVRELPFDEVDAAFAADEGEGDGTLAFWRQAHEAYFTRHGGFDPKMLLVCERFRVVEVL